VAQRGGLDTQGVAPSSLAPPLPAPVSVGVAPVKSVPGERPMHCVGLAAAAGAARVNSDAAGSNFHHPIRPALRRPSRRPRRSCHRRLRHGRRFSRCLAENVNTLWGVPTSGPPSRSQAVKVFDLFTDTKPNERKLLGDKT